MKSTNLKTLQTYGNSMMPKTLAKKKMQRTAISMAETKAMDNASESVFSDEAIREVQDILYKYSQEG